MVVCPSVLTARFYAGVYAACVGRVLLRCVRDVVGCDLTHDTGIDFQRLQA